MLSDGLHLAIESIDEANAIGRIDLAESTWLNRLGSTVKRCREVAPLRPHQATSSLTLGVLTSQLKGPTWNAARRILSKNFEGVGLARVWLASGCTTTQFS